MRNHQKPSKIIKNTLKMLEFLSKNTLLHQNGSPDFKSGYLLQTLARVSVQEVFERFLVSSYFRKIGMFHEVVSG